MRQPPLKSKTFREGVLVDECLGQTGKLATQISTRFKFVKAIQDAAWEKDGLLVLVVKNK
jgi:hypothetical protein